MKNKPDAFEQALRDSLEHFEVPYNSADWAQLEKGLSRNDLKQGRWSLGLLALLFGGAVALSTTVYLLSASGEAGIADQAIAVNAESPATEAPMPTAGLQADQRFADLQSAEPAEQAAQPGPPVIKTPSQAPITTSTAGQESPMAPKTSSALTEVEPSTMAKPAPSGNGDIMIKPSITQGCPGTSVEFELNNMASADTRMLWNFGDGSFSTDPSPRHAYNKAGRYEVTLSMSSATGGTIFNKPVSDVIVIHERPEAAFNTMHQEYLDRVPSVHFENKSLKGSSYFWDFGDGNTSTLQVPTHVYKNKGDYTVSLVVTNAIGCSDRTERIVHIKEDYNLLAAPAFSPNGDGVEEHFIPDALKTLDRRFRMTVHDPRTGALIYETSDVKRPWNGRVNGVGAPCPTGDYVWMVEMKDGAALGGTYNGTVSLLR